MEIKCVACGSATESLGQVPLRVHGTTGGWKLVFGDWAELGEQMWPVDVFRCAKCGRLEMYDLDFSLPRADG